MSASEFDVSYDTLKELMGCRASNRTSYSSQILPIGEEDNNYYFISVRMFDGNRVVSRRIEVGRPRFGWHYDLDLKTNMIIVSRLPKTIAPTYQEAAWIAICSVRFLGRPNWSLYDRIYKSLHRWSILMRDLILPTNRFEKEHRNDLKVS